VGIMDHGRLLALDTPGALMRSLPGSTTLELATQGGNGPVLDALGAMEQVERVEAVDGRIRLYLAGDAPQMVAPAAAVLAEHGMHLDDVKLGTPSLEDVFIHLTGRTLR
jgi:ABC-2 type transport system ATP-binding protein